MSDSPESAAPRFFPVNVLRPVGDAAAVPTEGKAWLEVSLRNHGTQACRALRGSRTAYTIAAGKSYADRPGGAATKGREGGIARERAPPRPRRRRRDPANDTATVSARVGDSNTGSARFAAKHSDTFRGVTGLRNHLHRFWFEFSGPREALPTGGWIGCGVTAVDRADAEQLLVEGPFRGSELPPVVRVLEDVDVSELDAGHILPNMGVPTLRGVWFPRF